MDSSDTSLAPDDAVEAIAFLTRSRTRIRVLELASRDRATTRREFRARLDVARTTVQRNLDALAERGWLEATPDGYRRTRSGELLAAQVGELVDTVETVQRLRPVLDHAPLDDLDVEPQALADAEVTVAAPADPYAPVNRHVDALRTVDTVRLFTAVVGREAFEVVSERARAGECRGEVVLAPQTLETVRSDPSYAGLYDSLSGTDAVDLYVADGDLPYYLGLLGDAVQLGVEDENGAPAALLETAAEPVRTWAESKYAAVRERAEPVP